MTITTEFELAKQYGPRIAIVSIHWVTDNPGGQDNTGILTCNHAASSHKLPVFVAGSNSHTTPHRRLTPGQVYGPGDLPPGYEMTWHVYHHLTCNEDNHWDNNSARELFGGAKDAGYDIAPSQGS